MADANDSYTCPLCYKTIHDFDFTDHCENIHPGYENIRFLIDDNYYTVADYVDFIGKTIYVPGDEDYIEQKLPVPKKPKLLIELNVNAIINTTVDASGFASTLTVSFFLKIIDSLSSLINRNAKIDRDDFIPKYLMLLVLSDATDKVETFGKVTLKSENYEELESVSGSSVSAGTNEVSWQSIVDCLIAYAKSQDFNMTQRIAAKLLGPLFYEAIFKGSLFNDLKKTGTSQSKRLGVPHEYFYAVLSFFSSIKSPDTWSPTEVKYFRAKQVNSRMSQWELKPGNLMPFVTVDTREQAAPPTSHIQERDANASSYQYYSLERDRDETETYTSPFGSTPAQGPSTPLQRRM